MKHRFFRSMICLALLFSLGLSALTAMAASSSGEEGTYTDPDTGATFVIPEGWAEEAVEEKSADFLHQVRFSSPEHPLNMIQYSSMDLWGDADQIEEFSGLHRSDLNTELMYKQEGLEEIVARVSGQDVADFADDAVLLVSYSGNDYIEMTVDKEFYGIGVSILLDAHIENGYCYYFALILGSDEAAKDYESILQSFQGPAPAPQAGQSTLGSSAAGPNASSSASEYSLGFDPLSLLISFLITVAVYTLPVLFYHFAIQTEPFEEKRAKKAVILYGIFTFLLMSIVKSALGGGTAGYSVFLWSYVNYRILISGKRPEHAETTAAPAPAASPSAPQASAAPVQSAPQASQVSQVPQDLRREEPSPSAPLWPAQYDHAQDTRAGLLKRAPKAAAHPSAAPTPTAPTRAQQTFAAQASAQQVSQAPAVPMQPVSPAPAASPSAPQASAAPVQSALQISPAAPAQQAPAAYVPTPQVSQTPHIPAAPVQPAQQTPPAPTPRIRFCQNCGFRLLEDSRFCSCCGAPVASVEEDSFQNGL